MTVGNQFELKVPFTLKAEEFIAMYKQVLIQKEMPETIFPRLNLENFG